MPFRILLSAVVATGCVVCGSIASADDANAELFKTLDADADGVVEESELNEAQTRAFKRLLRTSDADGDGRLTREEFLSGTREKAPPKQVPPQGASGEDRDRAEIFDRLDSNGDGQLSLTELPEPIRNRVKPFLERAGRDSITKEQFLSMQRNQMRPGNGQPGNGQPGGQGRMLTQQMFDRMDQNGDGKLTTKEVPERVRAVLAALLSRLGRDAEGAVTFEELQKAAANRAAREGGNSPTAQRPEMSRPEMQRPERNTPPEGARPPMRRGPAFFAALDANGDQMLSSEELAKAPKLLGELDADKDGQLSMRELFTPQRPDGPEGAPRMARPEQGGNRRPMAEGDTNRRPAPEAARDSDATRKPLVPADANSGGREARIEVYASRIVKQFDKNGNNVMEKSEAPERLTGQFDQIDTNDNGVICVDELATMMKNRRQQ